MEHIDWDLRKRSAISVRAITMAAMLGVMAYLFMLIRFPLPFMPPFMDFDIAAVPELIGAFLGGPVVGVMAVAVKLCLKIALTGSSSAFTGEMINFMLGCAFVLPAWFVHSMRRTRRGAVCAMAAGTAVTVIAACFANIYLIIPLYSRMYGLNMDAVIAMTKAVNGYIDSVPRLVLFGIAPFNLIKCAVSSVITYFLYNRTVKFFEK
ncbi:MAG: ECF transporter S component [Synergistaceae bacterium]|nr:ECF transporter S component [Synergistaceae bacterium]